MRGRAVLPSLAPESIAGRARSVRRPGRSQWSDVMDSQRRVSVSGDVRFEWGWRLMAAAVLAAFALLSLGGATLAAEGDQPEAVCCDDRAEPVSRAEFPLARFEPAERKSAVARAVAQQEDPGGSTVERVLDQGQVLLDRYGGEKVLLAV